MKSSYLTNLVLLIIVLVMLWLSQREISSPQKPDTISNLSAAEVTDIEIRRTDNPLITLRRQQDAWTLVEPYTARANQTRINLLLSLLSSPIQGQLEPLAQTSLDQFGLDSPISTLRLNDQSFFFGGIEPLSKQRYVLHEEKIYLLEDNFAPLLNSSAGSYVDNRLITENQSITRILITTDEIDDAITIEQQDGHWKSHGFQASSDTLKALIDNWQLAYAMQVRHITEETINTLGEPQISVWLNDNEEPIKLLMSETAQTMQITNLKLQLQYDFPLTLKKQLLPVTVTE